MNFSSLIRYAPFLETAALSAFAFSCAQSAGFGSAAITVTVGVYLALLLNVYCWAESYFDIREKHRVPVLPLLTWMVFLMVLTHYFA